MSDLLGWIGTLALVALLWGAAFRFGADSRDGRDRWRRPRD
jgi:hypothetical protein